ncbi:hypothetical protein PACTADRAFT_75621 [Pachysolen tannophilus NRRL Y-2460]|uniref:Amino acid permease/ SLC12A domain-containing protein n=1 Tax=Pachysolen tannophilus NRRL Y-2460 TaxID=669874 RepID=A0A1E4TXP9_PACTA|nr:hypothetical protein PACTADRAFT_75621 [Pachysolen tannophilus NRRL Y-2460]
MKIDEAIILALGYKQEFKREFSLMTTFAVSFSVLGLLPSIASTMWYSLGYAGNAGLTWGWLVAMIGIQCVANSLAEVSSAFPTSGGLYYATAQLAPPKWAPFLSWCVGWSNWLVQITGAPSVDYGGACMILALKSFSDPSFSATNGQTYLLTMALTTSNAFLSSMPTAWLAKFNTVGSIFNSVFLIIIFLMILGGDNRVSQGYSKFNDNSYAWGITNSTEWPDGVSVIMSFLAVIWTMSGYDSPFHLAEECSNAQLATPRAIVMTSSIGGIMGFVLQLAIAYTIVDVDAAVNDELGQPFVSYLAQCLSTKMVYAATSFTIISSYFMGQACQIAASRVTYAYSRDGCFPFSKYLKRTSSWDIPLNAVWANWFIGQLLLLLIFAGGTAIDAIFSVGAIASFISFTTPVLLKITYSRKTFRPGPWNLGVFSIPCGIIACSFVIMMIPFLLFPEYRGADNVPDSMNWTVVVYFGPMLMAIAWFGISARKWFTGPKTNLSNDMVIDNDESLEVIEINYGPVSSTLVKDPEI